MKKIVFATIPMQPQEGEGWDPEGYVYKCTDNKNIEYDKKVRFAINGFLAKTLSKNDDVKVVQILVSNEHSKKNVKLQKSELEKLNENIGAELSFKEIVTEFDDSGRTIEKRFQELISELEESCEIFLDMTFGSKTLIPVLFFVLGFAEKFFDADIKNILYDKFPFKQLDNGKSVPDPDSCEIFDVTSLFYLNSLTTVMSAPDGKTALERLNKFLSL